MRYIKAYCYTVDRAALFFSPLYLFWQIPLDIKAAYLAYLCLMIGISGIISERLKNEK